MMQPLDLEILPLTDANPHDDLYSCAKIINRRQLFEPNRLRDEGRHEEERIAARVASIRNYLSQPGSSAYYARSKRLDEIIGWIGWLRPHVNHQSSAEFSNEKEEIDNKVDNEKDMDAIKSVSVERKALECEFFANEPFWTLSYVFVSAACRRSGVGTRLVQHFLATLQEQEPEAKVGFTSSPTARFMYEKQGFRVVGWFNYTFEDIDTEGSLYMHRTRWPYMTNAYRALSYQLDLDRLGRRQVYDGPADQDPEGEEW